MDFRRQSNHRWYFSAVLSVAVVCAAFVSFALFIGKFYHENRSVSTYKLADSWMVSEHGVVTPLVSLNGYHFYDTFCTGDSMLLSGTLPNNLPERSTLCLYTHLSSAVVFVGGRQIYSYDLANIQKGTMAGSGYLFVSLPKNASGKSILIKMTSSVNGGLDRMPVLTVVSSQDVWQYFSGERLFNIYVDGFLLMIGFFLIVISLMFIVKNQNFMQLFYVGVFSVLASVWALASDQILQLFFSDLDVITYLEYLCLYAMPIPFLMILIRFIRERTDKRPIFFLTSAMEYTAVGFFAAALILHQTGRVFFPNMLSLFYATIGFYVVALLIANFQIDKRMKQSMRVFRGGFLIVIGIILAETIRINYFDPHFSNHVFHTVSLFPVGALVFAATVVLSYLIAMISEIGTSAEHSALEELAQTDVLTGLFNRSKADERFRELDAGDEPYQFVFFDLNGLKAANDTYGHDAGDQLLSGFADILTRSFADFASIYRMGGDEFLVIVSGDDQERTKQAIAYLEELEKTASVEFPFTIDASYGVAFSEEIPYRNAEMLSHVADYRMYEMKRSSKKGRA